MYIYKKAMLKWEGIESSGKFIQRKQNKTPVSVLIYTDMEDINKIWSDLRNISDRNQNWSVTIKFNKYIHGTSVKMNDKISMTLIHHHHQEEALGGKLRTEQSMRIKSNKDTER